jgi:hypothetical protein
MKRNAKTSTLLTRADVAQREMELEESMRPQEVKQNMIVSPNG